MTRPARGAALVAIGDELLAGAHPDLNSPVLAARLLELGVDTLRVTVVGDDEARLVDLFGELAREHPLVITTGGLGPTLDDVTRHAAARAAGVELVRSEEALVEIRGWWREREEPMPRANERQALLPLGAELLPNSAGTAPGFRVVIGGCELVALPGPPPEVHAMLDEVVMPWLAARSFADGVVALAEFHLFGLSESVFADRAGDWMDRTANPSMGVSAKGGVLHVRVRARASTRQEADERLAPRVAAFRERFAEHVFSEREASLEHLLAAVLTERSIPVTTAESCTGGLVAARLTRVPGVSAVFTDGFVTYSDDAKTRRLGVDPELLARHGAVSAEVAAAMAQGAAAMSGARLAVSVTGIAGPGGGTPEKPVGTVWFGVWSDGRTETVRRRFPARRRDWVRELAASTALHLLWRAVPAE